MRLIGFSLWAGLSRLECPIDNEEIADDALAAPFAQLTTPELRDANTANQGARKAARANNSRGNGKTPDPHTKVRGSVPATYGGP